MHIDQVALETAAKKAMEQWGCVPDGDLFFSHFSLLWPVKKGEDLLMLKVVCPNLADPHTAEILKFYDSYGCVTLVKHLETIQLIERIATDHTTPCLSDMVANNQDHEATLILCETIAKLHSHDFKHHEGLKYFSPFRHRSEEMKGYMLEGRIHDQHRPLIDCAYTLCDELIDETPERFVPLHGDIHHNNVLLSPQRGWLALDPKGILGPRAYEYAVILCNPYAHKDIITNKARMQQHAQIISEHANVDLDLLYRFTFLHACQCAAWSQCDDFQSYCIRLAEISAELAGITFIARAV